MFEYLFLEIKQEVYQIRKDDWKTVSRVSMACFGGTMLCLIVFLVLKVTINWEYSYLFYFGALVFIVLIAISETIEKNRKLEDHRQWYFIRRIKNLKQILEDSRWNLYDLNGIEKVKELCRSRIEKKSMMAGFCNYWSNFFTVVLIPMVTLGLGALVSEKSDKDVLGITVGGLFIFFAFAGTIFLIKWICELIHDMKKGFYQTLLEDMDYLEIMYSREHNNN